MPPTPPEDYPQGVPSRILPAVDDHEMHAAVARINARHRDDDGPGAAQRQASDPHEVLAGLRKCGAAGLREDATGHDATDALTITLWLRREADRHELALLRAIEARQLPWRTVAAPLEFTSRNGFTDRIEALAARFPATAAAGEPAAAVGARDDTAARALLAVLIGHRHDVDEENAEILSALRGDLRDPAPLRRGVIADLSELIQEIDVAGLGADAAAALAAYQAAGTQ